MMKPEPIHVGPPRDRRRGKRILTLNNLYIALFASVLLFAAISIASELRAKRPGKYGRLYASRTLPAAHAAPQPIPVVQEQEIPDETVADPTLVNTVPAEKYLGVVRPVTTAVEPEAVTADSTSFAAPAQPLVATTDHNERLVLTGGAEGVRLDVRKVR